MQPRTRWIAAAGLAAAMAGGVAAAAYGVEVRLADGRQVEVQLDQAFRVVGREADEDRPGEVEGR